MEANKIPEQLRKDNLRFLKVANSKDKNAIESGWQKDSNYKHNDKKLIEHLNTGNNYGVLCGDGLIVLDFDDRVTQEYLLNVCPETFAVKTAMKGLYHLYYYVTQDINKKMDIVDFQGKGAYVIGAGSEINGKKYEVVNDKEIYQLTKVEFEKILKEVQRIKKIYQKGCQNFREFLRKISLKEIVFREGQQKNDILLPNAAGFFGNDEKLTSAFCKVIGHNESEGIGWCQKKCEFNCKQFRDWLNEHYPGTAVSCGCIPTSKVAEQVRDCILRKNDDEATEKIVEFIKKNSFIYSTRDDLKSEIWFYEDGIYKPNGKSKVKELARNLLGAAFTPQRANKVIAKVEADTYIDQEEFFNCLYLEEIPVQNGILNLETLELKEFTPDKIFFNKLPMDYVPRAKCELIDAFIEGIIKDKNDKKVIYELFGYCLWKDHFIEKAAMLVGEGRNGKSKLIALIKTFLGAENTCSVPLSEMKPNSTGICELFGRLANLAGDLNDFILRDTGLLKSITGRDRICAKRKFLRDLFFVNYSKQLFACNLLPKVYDKSLGFWSRWILLEFPYVFLSKKEYGGLPEEERANKKIRDEDILKNITTTSEMEGLLVKAIEGLRRLFKNKDFSYSRGTEEVKEQWIRKSDSFLAFCMDCLEESVEGCISKSELRKEFLKYYRKHNLKGASDKSIKATLENEFGSTTIQPNGHGNETLDYVWSGIKWREETEPAKEIEEQKNRIW